jgi:replicative DNA helicase
VVIGGRPSTGKSSLLQQVIHVSTFPHGKKVLLFSLDCHRTNVVERLMTREARVDPFRVREGLLTQDEVVALTAAANRLCNRRSCLVIDDTPRPTINYVVSRARKLHDIQEIALLAIDFVQLIETLPGRENREQEMSIIARSLKALAHELEIPVIAVSQLNRMSTGRDTARSIPRRPTTWDLRDSGALEDAADTVVLLHRPELYGDLEHRGMVEIDVAKQRNGPRGSLYCRLNAELGEFVDTAQSE